MSIQDCNKCILGVTLALELIESLCSIRWLPSICHVLWQTCVKHWTCASRHLIETLSYSIVTWSHKPVSYSVLNKVRHAMALAHVSAQQPCSSTTVSAQLPAAAAAVASHAPNPGFDTLFPRTAKFWRATAYIYGAYKLRQLQSAFLHNFAGWSDKRLEQELWEPHHTWAGQELRNLAVNTRGLYLKVRYSSLCA